jgi:hypothetical protein
MHDCVHLKGEVRFGVPIWLIREQLILNGRLRSSRPSGFGNLSRGNRAIVSDLVNVS